VILHEQTVTDEIVKDLTGWLVFEGVTVAQNEPGPELADLPLNLIVFPSHRSGEASLGRLVPTILSGEPFQSFPHRTSDDPFELVRVFVIKVDTDINLIRWAV
jgi:hypothetical protein